VLLQPIIPKHFMTTSYGHPSFLDAFLMLLSQTDSSSRLALLFSWIQNLIHTMISLRFTTCLGNRLAPFIILLLFYFFLLSCNITFVMSSPSLLLECRNPSCSGQQTSKYSGPPYVALNLLSNSFLWPTIPLVSQIAKTK
jgi:hypothetical protein